MRPPRELAKYVVYSKTILPEGEAEDFKYFQSMKEAKTYAKLLNATKIRIFKISYLDKGAP